MAAKKYVIGNFKGGVGKSTCAQMLGFEAATFKEKKTLIIDLDMQGNTSDVMSLTHMNFTLEEMGLIDPRTRHIQKSSWDGLERFR